MRQLDEKHDDEARITTTERFNGGEDDDDEVMSVRWRNVNEQSIDESTTR